MLLALLTACTSAEPDTKDTAPATTGCLDTPEITIASPEEDAHYAEGERVPLEGSGVSSVGEPIGFLWAVDGDVVVIGSSGGWTAEGVGTHILTLQGEDSCGFGQATVHVTVDAAADDTGDTDTNPDTDSGETGETGDTGDATPVEAVATPYGPEVGLPAGSWKGLSVGPDGVVWGAMTGGLVRFDPEEGTARVFGLADGLLSDSPTAVLAHSDGTVWVGHVADDLRQGEQVSYADGVLTVLQPIDYTESTEIQAVFRMREQPFGAGAGDVWMGTNEGVCVWDADVGVFAEHAHPTHPHGYTRGVGFTAEGDVWNGDAYQLSRWRYSNDGNLSPSADLYETIPTWPVMVEEAITIDDLDAAGEQVWAASELFGVAKVEVAEAAGTSTVSLYAEPSTARAVREDGAGNVWIGTSDGLWMAREDAPVRAVAPWIPADGVEQIAVDARTEPPTVWLGTSGGLIRVVGVPGGE